MSLLDQQMSLLDRQMRNAQAVGFGGLGQNDAPFQDYNARQEMGLANSMAAQQALLSSQQPRIKVLTFKDEMQRDVNEYLKDWDK